ncbi:MAG TPA: transcriptional regulator [Planctomycetales bacterium]|jgi:putative transcriptional regulator|nr:transcriptional regulator [Planctomycetales bacterium]
MNKRQETDRLKKEDGMSGSVENEILEALAEFTDALEKGEVAQRLTCRQVKLNLESSHYSPQLVKSTRKVLGVSQPLFARFLGVSAKTVRSWEQGVNPPSPMACRFMDEIRRAPAHWAARLREVVVTDSACESLKL